MGYQVFAGVRKKEDEAELSKVNDRIVPFTMDVTNRGMIQQAYDQISEHLQGEGLTTLVSNA